MQQVHATLVMVWYSIAHKNITSAHILVLAYIRIIEREKSAQIDGLCWYVIWRGGKEWLHLLDEKGWLRVAYYIGLLQIKIWQKGPV